MRIQLQKIVEQMERKKEPFIDESTIELFREYLKEVVLKGGSRERLRFSWIDS